MNILIKAVNINNNKESLTYFTICSRKSSRAATFKSSSICSCAGTTILARVWRAGISIYEIPQFPILTVKKLQIIILQTSLYVCYIDTTNDMFVKSIIIIIMNHLPVWQVIPENPGEQIHSKPPSSILVQVPLFHYCGKDLVNIHLNM